MWSVLDGVIFTYFCIGVVGVLMVMIFPDFNG